MIRRESLALATLSRLCVAETPGTCVGFGIPDIDERLGGGLAQAGLHEAYASSESDGTATSAFAAMLAIRAMNTGKSLLWLREDRGVRNAGRLHAPGLAELGCDPAHVILVTASDTLGLLRAAADAVKCTQVGAVVIEPWGKAPVLDLTASRRLAMSASASGVFTMMVRTGAEPTPSAAQTRWQVAAVPSLALPANAPGFPAFEINLLRHRGGVAGFSVRLEWNRDTTSFGRYYAPLPRSSFAASALGTDQAHRQAA